VVDGGLVVAEVAGRTCLFRAAVADGSGMIGTAVLDVAAPPWRWHPRPLVEVPRLVGLAPAAERLRRVLRTDTHGLGRWGGRGKGTMCSPRGNLVRAAQGGAAPAATAVLLEGPPGAGKSTLVRCAPTLPLARQPQASRNSNAQTHRTVAMAAGVPVVSLSVLALLAEAEDPPATPGVLATALAQATVRLADKEVVVVVLWLPDLGLLPFTGRTDARDAVTRALAEARAAADARIVWVGETERGDALPSALRPNVAWPVRIDVGMPSLYEGACAHHTNRGARVDPRGRGAQGRARRATDDAGGAAQCGCPCPGKGAQVKGGWGTLLLALTKGAGRSAPRAGAAAPWHAHVAEPH
jgi:hypothetical protein